MSEQIIAAASEKKSPTAPPLPQLPCLPPPPPPPELPLIKKDGTRNSSSDASSPEISPEPYDHILQKLVQKLIDWGLLGSPATLIVSRNVQHIPQIGPKCGLVALNMALSVCLENPVTVDELLNLARTHKFTNHGEMFCAKNLMRLAVMFLPNDKVEIVDSSRLRNQDYVANTVASGNLLLVPYDSSRNFSPECLQGHKAHWAIITGVVIPTETPFNDSSSPLLKHLEPGATAQQEVEKILPAKGLHVLALQGKSRHLSAWPLQDLVDSNENLRQLDPEREASELEYIVPEGGLLEGLCGKAILIRP